MSAVATNRYPSAVLFSTLLHGGVIALLLLFTFVLGHRVKDESPIIELVKGEGDNIGATVAPALGSPDAVKLDTPPAPKNEPAPTPPVAEPEPATPPPAPIEAVAPTPAPPVAKPTPTPDLTKTVRTIERKNAQTIQKIRTEEKKKAEAEARAQLTKEQFDKLNKGKSNPTVKPGPAAKIPQVTGMGIPKGVAGGSTANMVGGAGGSAMTREESDLMLAYYAMFKDRLFKALEPPPGVSDSLVATVTATITSTGSVINGKITSSSGNEDFDRAVMAALGRVRMIARPDHRTDSVRVDVKLHDVSSAQ